jgi:hypothetical protein
LVAVVARISAEPDESGRGDPPSPCYRAYAIRCLPADPPEPRPFSYALNAWLVIAGSYCRWEQQLDTTLIKPAGPINLSHGGSTRHRDKRHILGGQHEQHS